MKKNILISCIIIIVFLLFASFVYYTKQTNKVLGIIDATTLQIDLNNNGLIDDNETVCIGDLKTFPADIKDEIPKILNKEGFNKSDIISLNYLAREYSYNTLFEKDIKFIPSGKRTINCIYGDILVENQLYSQKLLHNGFAWNDKVFPLQKIKENVKSAKDLDLVIFNHKSNKFHKLDCKYGLLSHDYIIIPKKQLQKDTKPCKFCHVPKSHENSEHITEIHKDFVKSSGNIKLLLPDYTTMLKPNRNCSNEVCKTLLNSINNSKNSIDIAMYGADNIPKLYNALLNAKKRGVKIRVVYDKTSNIQNDFYKETDMIVKLADKSNSDYDKNAIGYTNKLMHNKFIIFDNSIVWTGSMNFSSTGLSGFNENNIIIIHSKDVANLYTAEFNQMLSGKFHERKVKTNLPNKFDFKDSKIQVYFSPYDKSVQHIIPLIDNAKKYIYLPTFLITHKDLASALLRAKTRGVEIKIILDANNVFTQHSKHQLLRINGIKLKTENYAGKMHSKSIIIDDKYIVTGSMNFSNSGENKNDENLLIIENPELAKFYREFFLYLWSRIPDIWLTKSAKAEGKDSLGSCSDGIDNDFDGLIDKADSNCSMTLYGK